MPEVEEPKFQLSPIQIAAAALASVTAAALASYFGVAGTIVGTALASVVSTVGMAIFSHTMRRASKRVGKVAAKPAFGRRGSTPHPSAPAERPARTPGAKEPARPPARATRAAHPMRSTRPAAWNRRQLGGRRSHLWQRMPTWAVAAIGAAGAFVVAMLVVTVIEAAGGHPLSSLIWHQPAGSRAPSVCVVAGCDATPTAAPTSIPTQSAPGATSRPTVGPSAPSTTPPTSVPSASPQPTGGATPASAASPGAAAQAAPTPQGGA